MPLVLNSSSISGLAAVGGLSSPQTGSVLQIINATASTEVGSSTATLVDTTLTATITPKFVTSKILVLVNQNGLRKTGASPSSDLKLVLVRDGSVIIGISLYSFYTNSSLEVRGQTLSTSYLDSPATTSAVVYKTQFSNPDAAGVVNVQNEAGNAPSTITLMEIAG
jgi:hypothetical protein